jgi:hypothetical protein
MKADWRISVKVYSRPPSPSFGVTSNKNLKVPLARGPAV